MLNTREQSDCSEASGTPAGFYRERLAEAGRYIDRLGPVSLRISWLRLVAFLGATAAFFAHAWMASVGFPVAASIGSLFATAFVGLVIWHRRIARQTARWRRVMTLCGEGLARMDRRWKDLVPIPSPSVDDEYGVIADLDILVEASLYRLTGGAYTVRGRQLLAGWLLVPAAKEEIVLRQGLVSELRDQRELLLELRLLTAGLGDKPSDPEPFLSWAEGEPWLLRHPGVLWTARVLAALPFLLGLIQAVGWIQLPLWLVAMVVNLAFTGLFAAKVHRRFDAVSSHKGGIEHYASLFRFVSGLSLRSPRGVALRNRLSVEGIAAHGQMEKLARISSFADLRLSAMMYFPIQMLTLIDFHVLCRMERWQVRVGKRARDWLEALGEMEGFAGLATLAHDNPGYTFPEVTGAGEPRFVAKGLGHPLLDPAACVPNDVDLGEPGRFLLVTGSNMSGKSSLLRSIGLSAALAGAGGPVSAASLTLTPFVLGTSFRVVDSISDGVSFFMAELKRLKQIVTRAEAHVSGGPSLLFLLDEILQGTNIIERRVAVAGVVGHLTRLGCLGAVSSHDLTLAEAEGVGTRADTVYFTESFRDGEKGREMIFDYILRQGLAPTTNALELLRLVGLDVGNAGEASSRECAANRATQE